MLLGAVDLLFLLAALALSICARLHHHLRSAQHQRETEDPLLTKPALGWPCRRGFHQRLALGASLALDDASVVLLALMFLLLPAHGWAGCAGCVQRAFPAAQLLVHLAAAGTVVVEKVGRHRRAPTR
ncbi:hypothetical protein D1007_29142 [Hordeum vulgare]|nr:hypothetical protein D1007_29142 [Hordeum vulgare]